MLGDIFRQRCKILKSGVTPGENQQGVEFNWQIIVDGGVLSTFSGFWSVTQLGRCQLLTLGWTEILLLTQAVLTRSPLPLVGALTPHSHRHPHSGVFTWKLNPTPGVL